LAGLSVVSQYDSLLRRSQLQPKNGGTPLSTTTYGYNAQSGRLESVSDGTHSATYSYLANSPLISQITFKQSTTTRMTSSKQYDRLNRLLSIASTPSGTGILPVSFSYQYNDANQRYRVTLQDGSFWFYEYDNLGQLRSGKKFWSDGTPVPGQFTP
jgi:YD repeat-containing protein